MQALSSSLACLLLATFAQAPSPGPGRVIIPAQPQPGQPIPRPAVRSAPARSEPTNLVGIVSFPGWSAALLSDPVDPHNSFVIAEAGDRYGQTEMVEIDGKAGRVKLRFGSELLTLALAKAGEGSNPTVHLQAASVPLVLELYQQLAGQTVIRPSTLPKEPIALATGPNRSTNQVLQALADTCAARGVELVPFRDKFVFALPPAERFLVDAMAEPKVGSGKMPQALARGVIKFQQADLLQVLDVYQELAARTLLRPTAMPYPKLSVRNQTPLTRSEVIWLLDALLLVNGILTQPEGDKFVFALTPAQTKAGAVLKFDPETAPREAGSAVPEGTLRFMDADPMKVLDVYAALVGRQPLPPDSNLPRTKFSLRPHHPFSKAEALYALEALARLNGLTFQLVGADRVQLVPWAQPTNKP